MRNAWAVGIGVLLLAAPMGAQAPGPAPVPGAVVSPPALPEALRLERDNVLLQARVTELETQIAALRAQVINERIGKLVPALISKLEAAAPGWAVDPQTLELKPKDAAAAPGAVVPAAPRAAAPDPDPVSRRRDPK